MADDGSRIAELEQSLALRDRELAELRARLAEATAALAEARARERAIAEIVGSTNRSPDNLAMTLHTVAANTARLCEAHDVIVFRLQDGKLGAAARLGPIKALPPRPPLNRGSVSGRAVLDRRTVHVDDMLAEAAEYPEAHVRALADGSRTYVGTPLLRHGEPVGAIVARRNEVRPFSERHIWLLETFADQAVIAIENARLFQELQERTGELAQSVEAMRALGEVGRAVGSSLDLERVLTTIVHHAVALSGANYGSVWDYDAETGRFSVRTQYGWSEAALAILRRGIRPFYQVVPESQAALPRGEWITVEDLPARARSTASPTEQSFMDETGVRAVLLIPLMREGRLRGSLAIFRTTPGTFAGPTIRLLEAFADQAVIALENARLFEELQTRTRELERSVEELRALAQVGQAVNSTLDLDRVLETIVQHAVRLADADGGRIFEWVEEAQAIVPRSNAGYSVDELSQQRRERPDLFRGPEQPLIRAFHAPMAEALRERRPVQADYADNQPHPASHVARQGHRSVLYVPLAREGVVVGVLAVSRKRVAPFAEQTVRLLQTLADQSALAIQNARLYAQIERQRAQLEEVSKHKSEFLANMSHELRTPLNSVIGFSEVLLDPDMPVDDATRTQFLENILQSGKHLLALINDILDLSKVEAGKLELFPEDFDLAEALGGVHAVVRALADKKRQHLTLAPPDAALTLHHDPGRFKQVLFNLLSNAVKFTPEGGSVTTSARLEDDWVEVSVADTGVGIAQADQARVFEEFRQIDSGYARQQQGTGLGLALVRNYVRLMGGDVAVASAVGRGSTFTVRLPLRQGDRPAEATPAGAGVAVLVVEDDLASGDLLAYHLARGGYAVERARNADEALARARSAPPAAVTLDLRLPDEADGWSLLRRLKGDPATAAIPVVVVSVLDDDGLSRQAGAVAHLVKPVAAGALLATLGRVVGPPAGAEEAAHGR